MQARRVDGLEVERLATATAARRILATSAPIVVDLMAGREAGVVGPVLAPAPSASDTLPLRRAVDQLAGFFCFLHWYEPALAVAVPASAQCLDGVFNGVCVPGDQCCVHGLFLLCDLGREGLSPPLWLILGRWDNIGGAAGVGRVLDANPYRLADFVDFDFKAKVKAIIPADPLRNRCEALKVF